MRTAAATTAVGKWQASDVSTGLSREWITRYVNAIDRREAHLTTAIGKSGRKQVHDDVYMMLWRREDQTGKKDEEPVLLLLLL